MRKVFILAVLVLFGAPAQAENDLVAARIAKFEMNGKDMKAIFRQHLPKGAFGEIEAAAKRIGDFAAQMPDYFPKGSDSRDARPEIWENWDDFKAKAAANEQAARAVLAAAMAKHGDAVAAAAKRMGGTCKACHQAYRR